MEWPNSTEVYDYGINNSLNNILDSVCRIPPFI